MGAYQPSISVLFHKIEFDEAVSFVNCVVLCRQPLRLSKIMNHLIYD